MTTARPRQRLLTLISSASAAAATCLVVAGVYASRSVPSSSPRTARLPRSDLRDVCGSTSPSDWARNVAELSWSQPRLHSS